VSLRLRLLIVIAAVEVVLLLLVVWLGLETATRRGQVSPEALVDAFRVAADPDLERLPPTIRYVARLRRDGDEIEGSWTPEADAEVHRMAERLRTLVDERQARIEYDSNGLTRIDPSAKAEWSAFYVAFTEVAQQPALEGLQQTYILFCSGTILLIGATFLVLRQLVFRPLEQLANAARAVAEGKPPPKVPRPKGNDEVAKLVDHFNRMAHEVHEYQARLEERGDAGGGLRARDQQPARRGPERAPQAAGRRPAAAAPGGVLRPRLRRP
jgi:HAMP domain-containing protein